MITVFFRLLPSGEIQFIHPKDGVFQKKVNEELLLGNVNSRLGKSNPASIKFTGTSTFDT
jgi:photosystem I subunit 2